MSDDMNHKSPRILIIYPYERIESNPTMVFLLESLNKRRIHVDVLLEETERYLRSQPFGDCIHLKFLPSGYFHYQQLYDQRGAFKGLATRLGRKLLYRNGYFNYPVAFDPVVFQFIKAKQYSVFIGVDPVGIAFADRLNTRTKKALVYISFEMILSEEVTGDLESRMLRMERAACKRTSLVLIQDTERAEVFCRETSFPSERILTVPVAPPPEEIVRSDYLRKTLGIPAGRRIVLYCGNLAQWASLLEWAEMVSYWPDDYCLVLHSGSKVSRLMGRYLKRLTETKKIYISSQPVARQDITNLIASADYGLAPYKPVPATWETDDNMYYLGLSSGKVSYYAMCGLPILARSLPVFEREFLQYDCGKVFRRLAETGELLERMDRNYAYHSNEARRFYHERLNPVTGMQNFCDQLMSLAAHGRRRNDLVATDLPAPTPCELSVTGEK
jgi:hypothetical protein